MANGNGANIGFEKELWQAADALRSNMDAAEYKHIVLGLLFLKYISDAFDEQYHKIDAERANGADPEDPDEYTAKNVFWVPQEARWSVFKANAKQPTIGKMIDDAMIAIEKNNPALKGVLPKDYAHPRLDKQRLGQLIDLVSNIGLGDKENRTKDMLGRVYEYFLSQFASAEGKRGGQFYTPQCIVRLLVEMLAPYKGRIFDPACGSGGMFVQSEKFVEAHGGKIDDISIYGQESNHTTWRLAKMNLAIRGIDGNLGKEHADSFHKDLHPDLKADFVLANPPFNDSDWRGDLLKDDKRWKFGTPPPSNANFAWVQHFIHHLAPNGMAGFVLANGSMSTNTTAELEIRKNIIEADLVDCMVALPGQLFYSTQIPVCLWFLTRNKNACHNKDHRGYILFIDARKMGVMIDRAHRSLLDTEIESIANTYHAWQSSNDDSHLYDDKLGFCKAVHISEIRKSNYDLSPGRYVGTINNTQSINDIFSSIKENSDSALCHIAATLDLYDHIQYTLKQDSVSMKIKKLLSNTVKGRLKDIVKINRDIVNPIERPNETYELYSIPALDTNGLPEYSKGSDILSGKISLKGECILLSKLNPHKSRVWLVSPNTENAICSTEFLVIEPMNQVYFDYLFLLCLSQSFRDYLIAHAAGSTGSRQRVKSEDVLSAVIDIPNEIDAKEFSEFFSPYRKRLGTIDFEKQILFNLCESISNALFNDNIIR